MRCQIFLVSEIFWKVNFLIKKNSYEAPVIPTAIIINVTIYIFYITSKYNTKKNLFSKLEVNQKYGNRRISI